MKHVQLLLFFIISFIVCETWSFQKSTAGHVGHIVIDLASYLNLYQLHNPLWETYNALHRFFLFFEGEGHCAM